MAQDLLFSEMMKRAMEADPSIAGMVDPTASEPRQEGKGKVISPKAAMILGSLADSASTYTFLKRGTRTEANPALQMFNKKPELVFPMGAAGAVGYALLHKLLSKKSPKIADMIAGNLGALHGSLAGHNLEDEPIDAFEAYRRDFTRKK